MDALITGLEKLILKKEQIKQGAMQTLLTGKKRLAGFGEGKGYKQSEVGEIPEDWEAKEIGDFCTCYSGGTPLTSMSGYYGGSIPWITSGDLNKTRIDCVARRITLLGLVNSSAKRVAVGNLLFALYGATAGVSAITNIDATINQAILVILPDSHNSTEFLFQYLRLRKNYLIKTYTQGGQPNFSGAIVKSFKIALPLSGLEQIAIANAMRDMDIEITGFNTRLGKYKKIKQGMMQTLLTGKIRLI